LIAPEAEARIADAFEYIHRDSPETAARWLRGIYAKIKTLNALPKRCAMAREQAFYPERELRQLIYHSHRVIFEVHEATATVRVVYVRHAAERTVGERIDDET